MQFGLIPSEGEGLIPSEGKGLWNIVSASFRHQSFSRHSADVIPIEHRVFCLIFKTIQLAVITGHGLPFPRES